MIDFILQYIPVELLFVAGAAATFFVWRYFGERIAMIAAAVFFVIFVHAKGRQDGWKQREQKGREDAEKAIRIADEARIESDRDNADPERLRSQDGFRRD